MTCARGGMTSDASVGRSSSSAWTANTPASNKVTIAAHRRRRFLTFLAIECLMALSIARVIFSGKRSVPRRGTYLGLRRCWGAGGLALASSI